MEVGHGIDGLCQTGLLKFISTRNLTFDNFNCKTVNKMTTPKEALICHPKGTRKFYILLELGLVNIKGILGCGFCPYMGGGQQTNFQLWNLLMSIFDASQNLINNVCSVTEHAVGQLFLIKIYLVSVCSARLSNLL